MSGRAFPAWDAGFQQALERLAIATRRPARSQHPGAVRSRARGRALEFADYRPYTPGDDPKLVDWRAFSRLGRLYLKQYEEERTRRVHLLVDTSASLNWGDGDAHKGRYVRRLAAALAWVALCRQDALRVSLLHDGTATPLPPVTSRAGAGTLFRRLGEVREGGRTGLGTAVRTALGGPGPGAGPAILLTDLLDPDWPQALDALAPGGEGAVLQVLAPEEWEPPLGEEVELEDAETAALCATRLGPAELAEYRRRLEDHLAQVRSQCRRLGLIHLALNTGEPLRDTVLQRLPAAGLLSG